MSIFCNMFDFNHDGKTDIFELSMGLALLDELENDGAEDDNEGDDL